MVVDLERRRGIAQYADLWVMVELLAHLADATDPDYRRCRRAVQGIVHRCARQRGSPERRCGIVSDSESELARIVTGTPLSRNVLTSEVLAEASLVVATTPDGQPLTSIAPTLQDLASQVATKEAEFATDLQANRRNVMAAMEAQEADDGKRRAIRATARRETERSDMMRDMIALQLARSAYSMAELPLPELIVPRLIKELRRIFATGIEFYVQIIRKVMFDGLNVEAPRNKNLMWDHRIAYNIGNTIPNCGPIWLVTNDPAFVEAATPVGYADRVLTVAAYRRWLERA